MKTIIGVALGALALAAAPAQAQFYKAGTVTATLRTPQTTDDKAQHDVGPIAVRGRFDVARVTRTSDELVILNVGTADGIQPGDEFAVVRVEARPGPHKTLGPWTTQRPVGRVRVERVLDDHGAEARLVTGAVRANDRLARAG